uniref:Uncharacterized protein n=1 Tax=virus sp. ctx9V1 TaxID=2828001 RepID=A0A8S5RDG1_9VIRU|nr:MAG TPA: hypothetical protein [virus sp. ctx9V1]
MYILANLKNRLALLLRILIQKRMLLVLEVFRIILKMTKQIRLSSLSKM